MAYRGLDMNRINQILRAAQSKFDERRKKEDELAERDLGIRERQMSEFEAQGQAERKTKSDAALYAAEDRASKATSARQQHNDAFEVSKGRMDPGLYNMRYGGGAAVDAGGGGGNGSGKASGLQDKDILKEYNDLKMSDATDKWKDFNGAEPDFKTYRTSVMDSIGNGQAPTPWEEQRLRNAKEATSGEDTTEDFRAGVSSELMKDGSLRFSDSGPKTEDSRMGWTPEVEAAIAKRTALFGKGGASALTKNNTGWSNQPQAAGNRQGMGSRSVGYPDIQSSIVKPENQNPRQQTDVPPTTYIGRAVKSGVNNYLGMMQDNFNGKLNGGISTIAPRRSAITPQNDNDLSNAYQAISRGSLSSDMDIPLRGAKSPKYKKDKSSIRQWQHNNMPPWYKR